MSSRTWNLVRIGTLAIMLAASGWAQEAESAQTREIQELRQEVAELKARLDLLEARLDALGAGGQERQPAQPEGMPRPRRERFPSRSRTFSFGLGGQPGSSSFSMEQRQDGSVRVEIEEAGPDGEKKKRTLEADSMEELLEEHPELRDRIGRKAPSFEWGPSMRMPFGVRPFGGLDPFRDFFQNWPGRRRPRAAPGMPEGSQVEIEVGEGGRVRATVRRKVDGEEKVETFEAESLAELRRQHPEIFGEGPGEEEALSLPGFPGAPSLPPSIEDLFQARGKRLGVMVTPLDAERARELGTKAQSGLEVNEVLPGSVAEHAGVRVGDVILEVEGKAVSSPADVRAALEKTESAPRIKVERDGKTLELQAPAKAPRGRRI